jgi:hypothetical protein
MGTGPIAFSLRISHARPISVLHPSSPRESNNLSHGHVDLQREYHWISESAEIQDSVELRGLLRALGDLKSIFRAIGCDRRLEVYDLSPPLSSRVHAYFDLAFAEKEWNYDPGKFFALFFNFSAKLQSLKPRSGLIMEWELLPVIYPGEKDAGWLMRMGTIGYGDSHEEARRTWALGIRFIQRFLTEAESDQFSSASLQAGVEIGQNH